MINTYHTSLAPPPVPPRLNRSTPVLIPTPLPSSGHSKPLIRFLVGVVVLQLVLSVGGFVYLYYNEKGERTPSTERQVGFSSPVEQKAANKALADMFVDRQTAEKSADGFLIWDMDHSIRHNINYYEKSWLTVLQSGEYYIYSTVTFSKSDSGPPLASRVLLKKHGKGENEIVMQAFCSLLRSNEKIASPQLCTATNGKVVKLEKGDQLSVWVQKLSLVDYGDRATSFGMYKL
ncbi:CD40 ligand [Echeneis naucrates]|uniref:Tumor necrosis factor ligand superfamily member 6-like n=1 Tax=Echeneis naucrates TaxID=173247 RepID=A0A665WNP2_ECHNA|nr:tumor necrosis factor ligand superfamily member 6-like [Echeneis naucrates]